MFSTVFNPALIMRRQSNTLNIALKLIVHMLKKHK